MSKSLVKNSLAKMLLNLCNIIIPVVIGAYVLRILDVDLYDKYNKYNADSQIFVIIGALGVYNYGVREIGKLRDDADAVSRFFSEMFIVGVVSNIIVSAAYILFALFSSSTDAGLKLIFSLQFIGNVFNFEWLNEGHEKYLFIAVKSILVRTLYLILTLCLVRKSDDIFVYAILCMGTVVLNALLSFCYIKRHTKFKIHGLSFKKHIKPLVLIFVIANVSLLYTQMDKILLGNLVTDHAVTVYQIPHYISGLLYGLLIAPVIVSLPRFSYLYSHEGKASYLALYKKIVSVFFMIFIPATVGIACLAHEIVVLYGSSKYLDCVVALQLFAVAQFFGALVYLAGDAMLFICGKEQQLVIFNLIGGLCNVILDLILFACRRFTPETAILTLCVSYLTVFILCMIYAHKRLKIKVNFVDKHSVLYLAASLIFIPVTLFIKFMTNNIWIVAFATIGACVVFYLTILGIFKDENLKSMLRKISSFFLPKAKTQGSSQAEDKNDDEEKRD